MLIKVFLNRQAFSGNFKRRTQSVLSEVFTEADLEQFLSNDTWISIEEAEKLCGELSRLAKMLRDFPATVRNNQELYLRIFNG